MSLRQNLGIGSVSLSSHLSSLGFIISKSDKAPNG